MEIHFRKLKFNLKQTFFFWKESICGFQRLLLYKITNIRVIKMQIFLVYLEKNKH